MDYKGTMPRKDLDNKAATIPLTEPAQLWQGISRLSIVMSKYANDLHQHNISLYNRIKTIQFDWKSH